ncbi:7TM diverse intracellular signaling domain-containing protein [Maridesulfovibrio sp.]|uniref:sensor histidine kinase n=1 Tax=Maridesulfovibrio sp. TaxID=2795000 RepID=UPI0039F02A71
MLNNIFPILKWKHHKIVFILITVIVLGLTGCTADRPDKKLHAERGVIDLRGQNLSGGRIFALNGEWEFYWDRLLTPEKFSPENNLPEMSGFFSLPGTWRGHLVDEKRLGSTGQATYRLKLLTDQSVDRLTLRIFDIHEAYKLWANGELIAQSGLPGISAETEKPARTLKLADIQLRGQPIDLILQVSNYHFRRGGIGEPILAALPGPLEAMQTRDWAISLFFAGCMLIMGIYHLVLYLWRKRDVAPLYFGLYCLLVVGYSVTSNSSRWVISLLLPGWNSVSMEVFSLTCFVCWASLLYRFLKTIYPNEFHSFPVYLLDARIVIFSVLLIFAPGLPLYWFIAVCLLQTFLYAAYYLHRVSLCVKRKRTGARILLTGLIIQFVAGINDPLVHMGIIKSVYLVEPAVCLFILSQSLVLSKLFSNAFSSVERLSVELEQKNQSLHEEMEERNRLEKKIVSISEEERRQLSRELHDSLCQQLTGARLRAIAMSYEHVEDKDGPELAELAEILKTSTHEAYKIARGLWPVEHGNSGPSLEALVRSIAKATGIRVTFNQNCPCEECMNENITALYRIAQEALTNAAKHSEAKNIHVQLNCCKADRIALTVSDDGVGRSASKNEDGGLGTSIMYHRAKVIGAQLIIEKSPLGGTVVRCTATCVKSNKNFEVDNDR